MTNLSARVARWSAGHPLLDAFAVRVVILPSFMLLLRNAHWWPSRGVRRARATTPSGHELEKVG